jgi:uncharacterized protein (DUF2336 family)
LALDKEKPVHTPVITHSPLLIEADFTVIVKENPETVEAIQKRRAANENFTDYQYQVMELAKADKLDEAALRSAMLSGNRPFVIAGLAVLARIPEQAALKVIKGQNAKTITALCWKAGVSAVFAMQVQHKIAGISLPRTVQPKPKGGYSLTEENMDFLLEIIA